MYTSGIGVTEKDQVITAEIWVMGTAATEAGTGAGMMVHAGDKGIKPTPPTPKMYRGSSAVIIPASTEVGQDKWRSRGVGRGGGLDDGTQRNRAET